jgi:hypothetical protein
MRPKRREGEVINMLGPAWGARHCPWPSTPGSPAHSNTQGVTQHREKDGFPPN